MEELTHASDSIDMQAIQGPGSGGQSKEIHTVSPTYPGIVGLTSGYGKPAVDFHSREAEENTAASPTPLSPTEGVGERSSEVCGEDLNCYICHMVSYSAFQSTPICNEFGTTLWRQKMFPRSSVPTWSWPRTPWTKSAGGVLYTGRSQCSVPFTPGYRIDIEPDASNTGWYQHGIGSPTRQALDRWEVVPSRNISPHQLPWTSSYRSSSTGLFQAQQWDYHSNKIGQCHSSDLHKQTGRNTPPTIVSTSVDNLGLVYTERCLSGGGKPTTEGQYNITADRELLSTKDCCNWMLNPLEDATADGTCVLTNKATTKLLHLETRPRSNCNIYVQSGWAQMRGFANPPWCLIARCLS